MKILLTFIALGLIQNAYTKCSMTGKEIIQKQKELQSVKFETVVQRMTLTDMKTKSKEKRTMKFFIKTDENEDDKSLIVFMDPADIKGTALLSHQHTGEEDDQWLYLPALRKTQRVAPGSKKKYFMGTDFTFADFEGEDLESFNYKCIGMKKCEAKKCFVVEAVPKSKQVIQNTGYAKRNLMIRDDIFVTTMVKFYDRRKKYIKNLQNSNWKKITKTVWRPLKAVMTRGKKHKTTMEVAERQVDKTIKDIVFEERYLLKGMHLR